MILDPFDCFDKDGDKSISKEEWVKKSKSLMDKKEIKSILGIKMNEATYADLFDALDSDNDGKVSLSEFQAAGKCDGQCSIITGIVTYIVYTCVAK